MVTIRTVPRDMFAHIWSISINDPGSGIVVFCVVHDVGAVAVAIQQTSGKKIIIKAFSSWSNLHKNCGFVVRLVCWSHLHNVLSPNTSSPIPLRGTAPTIRSPPQREAKAIAAQWAAVTGRTVGANGGAPLTEPRGMMDGVVVRVFQGGRFW